MLFYISVVTGYRWVKTFYFPEKFLIPDQLIIATVLISLIYVWAREVHDKQALQEANIKFIMTNEKLRQANINTITSLILSVEAKDQYTSGHSDRVMHYSLEIAKRMGFSEADLEVLRTSCLLHDIGKIAIPDVILNKVEKLNAEEWNIIKKHSQVGADILKPLNFLEKERLLILYHHERIDGTGYPYGLKDENIPLGARIMALADAYDAMKSRRAYREPLTDEAIKEEITKGAGTQFDAKIVEVFLNLLKEGYKPTL